MSALLEVPELPAAVERRLRELAYELTGIVLGPEKATLLQSRVAKRLRALRLANYRDYLELLERGGAERQQFVNVITTNTTSFWREPDHFPIAVQHVRDAVARGQTSFRVWCAASSTGQEPWTLALTLGPLASEHHLDLRILATDIDTRVLSVAAQAVYGADAIPQIPPDRFADGFERVEGGFRVVERYRRLVTFAQLNLTKPPFPMRGPLDLVFCRNVMIYLDRESRRRLVGEVERLLRPGGLLVVGHSESILGLGSSLEILRPSVCRRPLARAA